MSFAVALTVSSSFHKQPSGAQPVCFFGLLLWPGSAGSLRTREKASFSGPKASWENSCASLLCDLLPRSSEKGQFHQILLSMHDLSGLKHWLWMKRKWGLVTVRYGWPWGSREGRGFVLEAVLYQFDFKQPRLWKCEDVMLASCTFNFRFTWTKNLPKN